LRTINPVPLSRRSFFTGLGASLIGAPAVITRPGLLMPLRGILLPLAPTAFFMMYPSIYRDIPS
jgi:hypothetical protein